MLKPISIPLFLSQSMPESLSQPIPESTPVPVFAPGLNLLRCLCLCSCLSPEPPLGESLFGAQGVALLDGGGEVPLGNYSCCEHHAIVAICDTSMHDSGFRFMHHIQDYNSQGA